jgi:HEAT repeat protein
VLEKVLHLLRDREEDVRLATLDLLRDVASRGNRRAVACLCDFLAAEPDGAPRVRPRAVATLVAVARRGDAEALRALVVALDDDDPALRAAAAAGIAGLAVQGEPVDLGCGRGGGLRTW